MQQTPENDNNPQGKSELSEFVDQQIENRKIARKFIQDFETKLAHEGEAAAIECCTNAAAVIDEYKDNSYYLIAVTRVPYMLRNQIPDYWNTFKKVYDLFLLSHGELQAKRICTGLWQEAVKLNVIK